MTARSASAETRFTSCRSSASRGAGRAFPGRPASQRLFALQSGTPFTVLNGLDPAGVLQGIDSLVGNAIRQNQIATADLSGMNIIDLWNAVKTARDAKQPNPFFAPLTAG